MGTSANNACKVNAEWLEDRGRAFSKWVEKSSPCPGKSVTALWGDRP